MLGAGASHADLRANLSSVSTASGVYFQFVSARFAGFRDKRKWSRLLVVPGLIRDDDWREGAEGPVTRITQQTYERIVLRFDQAISVGEEAISSQLAVTFEDRQRLGEWLKKLLDRAPQAGREQLIRVVASG